MNKKYFKLYACCVLVNGTKRAGICDLQRSAFESIPLSLYHFLNEHKNISYNDILSNYPVGNKKIIDEYYSWLITKEFGFWCDESDFTNFIEMDCDFHIPSEVSNAIIDIDKANISHYNKIIMELIQLSVPHIEIHSFIKVDLSFFQKLIKKCSGTRVKSVDIITPYIDKKYDFSEEIIIKKEWGMRLNTITFYNSPNNDVIETMMGLTRFIFIKRNIFSSNCCGNVSSKYFTINTSAYTESLKFNTCLNRKISIDVNGEIKNCPSIQKSYGNIKDTTLKEALSKNGFKDLWDIKKDDIKVCQDCEFRHICTDCRAYIDNPNDIYSRPAKCNYNPYQAKWKGEEGYIPVIAMSKEEIESIKTENA